MNEQDALERLGVALGGPVAGLLSRPVAGGWYFWPDPDFGHGVGAGSYLVAADGSVYRKPWSETVDQMVERLGLADPS